MKIDVAVGKETGIATAYLVKKTPKKLKSLEEKKIIKKKNGELLYSNEKRALLFLPKTPEEARLCGARIQQWAERHGLEKICIIAKALTTEQVQHVCEGILLSDYKPEEFKTEKRVWEIKNVKIVVNEKRKEEINAAIKKGIVIASAQNFVRALDERPSNVITPNSFAEQCARLAKQYGFRCEVWDEVKITKKGMNGILAVGKGSAHPPRFVILEYGKKYGKGIALVGKGVTFDTGGISLKPSRGMEEMKYDKTGACLVLGVFKAVAELKLPIHLYGFLPLVENVPSGTASKPGDIVKMYNGKTVEIINTDAEGRLILADALSYASQQKDVALIADAATLTGAMIIALGRFGIGYFTNDDGIARVVEKASALSGERVWRFPLWPEYRKMLESHVADIKNLGSERGEAGSITAAMFLKEFVSKPWVHFDIAGVDIAPNHPYYCPGATGIGLNLLFNLVEHFRKKGKE